MPAPDTTPMPLDGDGHVESLGEWCDCGKCLAYREAMRAPPNYARAALADRLDDMAGLNPQALGANPDGTFPPINSAPSPYWRNAAAPTLRTPVTPTELATYRQRAKRRHLPAELEQPWARVAPPALPVFLGGNFLERRRRHLGRVVLVLLALSVGAALAVLLPGAGQ